MSPPQFVTVTLAASERLSQRKADRHHRPVARSRERRRSGLLRNDGGDFPQPFDIPHRRLAEVALVLAAEVRRVLVPDPEARLGGVEVLAQHQPPGLLEPKLLLELQAGSWP